MAQDGPSLADIARQARAAKHKAASDKTASSAVPASTSAPEASSKSSPSPVTDSATPKPGGTATINVKGGIPEGDLNSDSLKQYEDGIRRHFEKEEFALLDGLATEARKSKSRLPGGFWTIHIIYGQLDEPDAAGIYKSTDIQYEANISRLKRWIAQRPQSITARVALAGTYMNYAWKARGKGFADTVTEEGWRLYSERSAIAGKILAEAYDLPEKCPEWYLYMMAVTRAQDGSIELQRAVFEKAVAFEPEYHYFHRDMAYHLLPKWGGEEGEVAAFATQVSDRLGGVKGDIIYYQIAREVICGCPNEKLNGMSWERIKKGYAALEAQYGISKLNLNKMTRIAVEAEDLDYAQQTFDRIGEAWDPETWETRAHFDEMRDWVKGYSQQQSIEVAIKEAQANLATPYGQTFDAEVAKAFSANYSAAMVECQKKFGDSSLLKFDVLLRLDQTGNVDQMFTTARPNVADCVMPELQKDKFPAAPQKAYWVKISTQPGAIAR